MAKNCLGRFVLFKFMWFCHSVEYDIVAVILIFNLWGTEHLIYSTQNLIKVKELQSREFVLQAIFLP